VVTLELHLRTLKLGLPSEAKLTVLWKVMHTTFSSEWSQHPHKVDWSERDEVSNQKLVPDQSALSCIHQQYIVFHRKYWNAQNSPVWLGFRRVSQEGNLHGISGGGRGNPIVVLS